MEFLRGTQGRPGSAWPIRTAGHRRSRRPPEPGRLSRPAGLPAAYGVW